MHAELGKCLAKYLPDNWSTVKEKKVSEDSQLGQIGFVLWHMIVTHIVKSEDNNAVVLNIKNELLSGLEKLCSLVDSTESDHVEACNLIQTVVRRCTERFFTKWREFLQDEMTDEVVPHGTKVIDDVSLVIHHLLDSHITGMDFVEAMTMPTALLLLQRNSEDEYWSERRASLGIYRYVIRHKPSDPHAENFGNFIINSICSLQKTRSYYYNGPVDCNNTKVLCSLILTTVEYARESFELASLNLAWNSSETFYVLCYLLVLSLSRHPYVEDAILTCYKLKDLLPPRVYNGPYKWTRSLSRKMMNLRNVRNPVAFKVVLDHLVELLPEAGSHHISVCGLLRAMFYITESLPQTLEELKKVAVYCLSFDDSAEHCFKWSVRDRIPFWKL